MAAITLPVAGAVEFARIAKALSTSAAHKQRWADERVKSVLLRRTSPDVLTLTGTDRYVGVESALRVENPACLDAVPVEGLLVDAADLAALLAMTASEVKAHDTISVTIEFSGQGAMLRRDDKAAAASPGTGYAFDVPGLFPESANPAPLLAPVVAPERMATIAAMLPESEAATPIIENATPPASSNQRIMWRWGDATIRSRVIVMCMNRSSNREAS